MFFMALASQREDAPHFGGTAGRRKNFGLFARDGSSGVVHLFAVIHDAVR